jgi:hypothetical protein
LSDPIHNVLTCYRTCFSVQRCLATPIQRIQNSTSPVQYVRAHLRLYRSCAWENTRRYRTTRALLCAVTSWDYVRRGWTCCRRNLVHAGSMRREYCHVHTRAVQPVKKKNMSRTTLPQTWLTVIHVVRFFFPRTRPSTRAFY